MLDTHGDWNSVCSFVGFFNLDTLNRASGRAKCYTYSSCGCPSYRQRAAGLSSSEVESTEEREFETDEKLHDLFSETVRVSQDFLRRRMID